MIKGKRNAEALLMANAVAKSEVVNVGNTQEVTILELTKKVKDIIKY